MTSEVHKMKMIGKPVYLWASYSTFVLCAKIQKGVWRLQERKNEKKGKEGKKRQRENGREFLNVCHSFPAKI